MGTMAHAASEHCQGRLPTSPVSASSNPLRLLGEFVNLEVPEAEIVCRAQI